MFRVRNNKNKRIPCSQAYTWQHSLMKLTAKSTVQYYIDIYILYSLKIDYIFQKKIRRRMLALPAYYCDGTYYKFVYWERCPWGVFYIEQHPHDNISSSHLYYRLCIYKLISNSLSRFRFPTYVCITIRSIPHMESNYYIFNETLERTRAISFISTIYPAVLRCGLFSPSINSSSVFLKQTTIDRSNCI